MKTAIVVGATGLVGKQLIGLLCQDSRFTKVVAITRKPYSFYNPKVINKVIDFSQLSSYKHCFVGDALFSCLGTTLKQAGSRAAQRIVDVEYQLQIAQIASLNKVTHYFLVSSSGANSNAVSSYFKMKGELEDKVKTLTFNKITILRPSLLIGQRSQTRIGETFASYLLSLLCKIPPFKRYRPITGRQVARKLVDTAHHQTDKIVIYSLQDLFTTHRKTTDI